jgi:hypothetical protein
MVNLQDLPTELLQHILSFVAGYDDRNDYWMPKAQSCDPAEDLEEDDEYVDDDGIDDLCEICLVSRKFRELAQPLVFRNFMDDGLAGGLNQTIRFTKAIHERPDLGEHVQKISIVPLTFGPMNLSGITDEHIKFYKGILKDLQLGDMEKTWIGAMEHDELSVIIALLVNKTPNLRQLHMTACQNYVKPFPYLFSRDPSFLSKLTSVCIEADEEHLGYNLKYYQELLALPKLELASLEYGTLLDESFPSSWTPGTLSANDFFFRLCHFDAGAIKRFMQACKSLKSFTYNNFDLIPQQRRIVGPAPPEFNAAQATEAALLHKETLELFHVQFATKYEDIEEDNSTCVKFGSFGDFSVLKTIVVPHDYLPAHPQLPATLENLYIANCNASIWEIAQNIATDCKKGLYPQLTEVRVSALDLTAPIKLPGQQIPEGKTPEQCFLALQEMFKGTKVEFHISPYKLPNLDEYDDYDGYDDDEDFFDDGDLFMHNREDGFPEYAAAEFPAVNGHGHPLLDMLMQRALQDPDFAHPLLPRVEETDDSWETDDDDM